MTAPSQHSIVFMGTPDFAVPTLEALLAAGYPVKAVFTQPDRPVGRGQQLAMPPVKQVAVKAGLPVYQPQKLRADEEVLQALEAIAPDLIVVVAYGQILPERVLNSPKFGCINVHASLLPRYRGAAPIQWSILHGDAVTGVTTMQMEKGLDTGPMILKAETPIGPDETADQLSERLSHLGADLLVRTLPGWFAGELKAETQDDSQATYASMLRKEMAPLDWTMSAQALHNRIRALTPWPGSTAVLDGETFKITAAAVSPEAYPAAEPGTLVGLTAEGWDVACGDGALRIKTVQLPGKKPQEAAAVARGWRAAELGKRLQRPGT